jgi:uncharacterized protein YeaO (DUF488 family)
MKLRLKRVYEPATKNDGKRILVDRLWPRGLSKAKARIDFWAKAIAPSNKLRLWYQHDTEKWPEFRRRYFAELKRNTADMQVLVAQLGEGKATLLFGSKETRHNNAAALKAYLEANW